MGRKQDQERKEKQQKQQSEKLKTRTSSSKKGSDFFTNLLMTGVGLVLLSLLFGYLGQDQMDSPTQQVDLPQTEKHKAHRDFEKYNKEVVNEEVALEFQDTEIATKIIDYYQQWSEISLHPKIHYDTGMAFNRYHLGLKNDFDYCKKSDLLKLQHPEMVYDNYYILSDFGPNELPRELTRSFGVDVMPKIYMGMRNDQHRRTEIDQRTSLINSRISRFHHFHHFGKCLFCVFQTSNHVPGKWAITGKDLVIDNLRSYLKKPFKNTKECTNTVEFMPPSYRLYDKAECKAFFKHLDSEEYKNKIDQYGIGFILKAGRDIHRGEGIEIVIPEKEQELRKTYKNGKRCGQVSDTLQAQTYIANPMLYKKRKIEVRIYFFIASTNPLIIYSQNLAHLRMCGTEFDLFSKRKEVHVCNVAVAKSADNNFVVDFSLDGLRDYLIEEKVISNKNWIEEEIYPQIYRAITHITRLGEHDFLKDSKVNENFALDFLLDDNSKIWFMENNPNPQILRMSDSRVIRHYKMFGDMFEIQFKYLRSRFKRLQQLAVEMKYAIKDGTFDEGYFKKRFKQADKNKLEPEFQIDSRNTYQKIYDETLEGADIFCGNLPEACLYTK